MAGNTAVTVIRIWRIALIGAALVLLCACGSARRSRPLHGPLQTTNAVVERGEVVFMRHCQKCHPQGEAGLGPALNNKPLPDFMVKFQVRNGLGMMPSFPQEQISPDDLDALVEYMAALRDNDE